MLKVSGLADANELAIEDDGIIRVTLHGGHEVEKIRDISERVNAATEEQFEAGHKAMVLFDFRDSGTQSTAAQRFEARRQFAAVKADAIALVGGTQNITLGLYIARLAKPNLNIRSFKTMDPARRWLKRAVRPKKERTVSVVGLITGLAVIVVGLISLIGWQFSNKYLTSVSPSLKPINPISAVGLLVIGYAFISFWQGKVQHVRTCGWFLLIVGLAALLPTHINYLLYGDRVTAAAINGHVTISISTALSFICIGVVGLIAGKGNKWVGVVEYAAGGLMGLISLFNLFGQLYAHDFVYHIGGNFVMSFNSAIGIAMAAVGLTLLTLYRQLGNNLLGNITRLGWLAVFALLFVQIATYATWNQVVDHNKIESRQAFMSQAQNINSSVQNVIQAYTNALYGFRGLYAASMSVSQSEFQTYYNSLNLMKSYPGLRSMAFISVVKTQDIPAFVASRRADNSLGGNANANFIVTNLANVNTHYITTYVSDPASNSGLGRDLASTPGRIPIYSSAIASGNNYSSGTVTFNGTATSPPKQGFFITIPVHYETNPTYVGVVNANFVYSDFFSALFSQKNPLKNLDIHVSDATGQTIYSSQKAMGTITTSDTFSIPIANSGWHMLVEAPKNFGISNSQASVPAAVLIAGQIFAFLLICIFISQTLARRQAMHLVTDATGDLKHERNKVLELHIKDQAMLSGLGEGLIAFDRTGRVERTNLAAQRMMDWAPSEIIGKEFSTAWPAVDMNMKEIPPSKRPISIAITKGKTVVARLYYTRKNGDRFPVEMNVSPIVIDGNVIGAIEVFRDITHEQELDKAKSEFVSLASHQLRTPLSAINWYAEMLLNGDAGVLNDDQREYLREIFEGNQRMVELVNSLLDVSRLELGRMANEPAPTSMVGLIDDLEKELATSIKTKGLVLKKDIQANVPSVIADPKQLRMVVQNLFSNAVKYTQDKGTVHITLRNATAKDVETARLRHSRDCILFSVKDTGFGIPKAQQKHIFEKLFRADNVRKLDVEGTGLGLYIVRQVTESMGGRVWFESTEGVGTNFIVVLPVRPTQPKQTPDSKA